MRRICKNRFKRVPSTIYSFLLPGVVKVSPTVLSFSADPATFKRAYFLHKIKVGGSAARGGEMRIKFFIFTGTG